MIKGNRVVGAVLSTLMVLMIGGLVISLVAKRNLSQLPTNLGNDAFDADQPAAAVRYVLDTSQSKFIAHAHRGGLFWFKGHDHYLAARDFSGEAQITPDMIIPATLRLVVKANSLQETGKDFTDPQKQIINKEVHDIVLQPDQYPEIVLQSTAVSLKGSSGGQYEVKIDGDLTLHGVTHRVSVPVKVTLNGNDMRAVGSFEIDRSHFKVKATSAFHGLVSVRNTVTLEFDIVGHRA